MKLIHSQSTSDLQSTATLLDGICEVEHHDLRNCLLLNISSNKKQPPKSPWVRLVRVQHFPQDLQAEVGRLLVETSMLVPGTVVLY